MISILQVKDENILSELYSAAGIPKNGNSSAVNAAFGDEVLGFCLFDLYEKGITVRFIEPANDRMLADGLLRSALHIAAERSAMDARYSETVSEQLLKKLDFISDINDKKLNIDKLFGGCGCKKSPADR